jgi:hypothetical protein
MSKAGLRKVTKTVRGKKGTVRRSYWVKSADNNQRRKSVFSPGESAYRKNSGLASANTGARVGLIAGLLGAHRIPGSPIVSGVGAQVLAHRQRKQYGQRGKSIFGKLGHGIATELGHTTGHFVGSALHEVGREGVRRFFRR